MDPGNRVDLGKLAEQLGLHPGAIIREAVTLKHRRFNTAFNLDVIAEEDRLRAEADELANEASEYRRVSRGGES